MTVEKKQHAPLVDWVRYLSDSYFSKKCQNPGSTRAEFHWLRARIPLMGHSILQLATYMSLIDLFYRYTWLFYKYFNTTTFGVCKRLNGLHLLSTADWCFLECYSVCQQVMLLPCCTLYCWGRRNTKNAFGRWRGCVSSSQWSVRLLWWSISLEVKVEGHSSWSSPRNTDMSASARSSTMNTTQVM